MRVPGPNEFTGKPRSRSTSRHQTQRHFRLCLVRQVPNHGWSRRRIRQYNSCSVFANRSRPVAAVRQSPLLPLEASRRLQTTRRSDPPPPIRRSHKGRARPCSLGQRSCIDMNRRCDTIGREQKSGRAGSWCAKSSEHLGKAVSVAVRAALTRRACTPVGESRRNPPGDSGRQERPEHGVGRGVFHAATSGLRRRSHSNAGTRLPGVPRSEVPDSVAYGRKKVRYGVLVAGVCNRSPLEWAGSRTPQPALIDVKWQAPGSIGCGKIPARSNHEEIRRAVASGDPPATSLVPDESGPAHLQTTAECLTDGHPGRWFPTPTKPSVSLGEVGGLLRTIPLPGVSTRQMWIILPHERLLGRIKADVPPVAELPFGVGPVPGRHPPRLGPARPPHLRWRPGHHPQRRPPREIK